MATENLVDALAELSFLVQNALAEIVARHDLSLVQTRMLGVLRDREPTMNALGGHLGLDKSSITGLVSRAERRGLVTRTASETDRRVTHVSMTDAGHALAREVEALFKDRIEQLTAVLPDGDRATLARLASVVVLSTRH